jgi:fluoride exporter
MKFDLKKPLIWIALGGSCGALLRHLTNLFFEGFIPHHNLFTAIAFENVFGSFLMGYFYSLFISKKSADELKQFMLIGIIGSYTTYSGFGLEAMGLLGESPVLLSVYIFSQVFLGLTALAIGLKLGE